MSLLFASSSSVGPNASEGLARFQNAEDDELEMPSYLDTGDRLSVWEDLKELRSALNNLGDIKAIRKYIKLNLSLFLVPFLFYLVFYHGH